MSRGRTRSPAFEKFDLQDQHPTRSRQATFQLRGHCLGTPLYHSDSHDSMPSHVSHGDAGPHCKAPDVCQTPEAWSGRNNSYRAAATSRQCIHGFTHLDTMNIRDVASIKGELVDTSTPCRDKHQATWVPTEEITLHCISGHGNVVRRENEPSQCLPSTRLTEVSEGSQLPSATWVTVSNPNIRTTAGPIPSTSASTSAVSLDCESSTWTLPYTPVSCMQGPPRSKSETGDSQIVENSEPRPETSVDLQRYRCLQSLYICTCCSKRPKKFETADELS